MKIRNGFVSNSSSSSFCIIGVSDSITLRDLAKAEKFKFKWGDDEEFKIEKVRGCEHKLNVKEKHINFCPVCGKPKYIEKKTKIEVKYNTLDYGSLHGKVISFYGNYYFPSCAGIDVLDLLYNMTIPQAKEHFCKLVREKLGVEIDTSIVEFKYGESTSE